MREFLGIINWVWSSVVCFVTNFLREHVDQFVEGGKQLIVVDSLDQLQIGHNHVIEAWTDKINCGFMIEELDLSDCSVDSYNQILAFAAFIAPLVTPYLF